MPRNRPARESRATGSARRRVEASKPRPAFFRAIIPGVSPRYAFFETSEKMLNAPPGGADIPRSDDGGAGFRGRNPGWDSIRRPTGIAGSDPVWTGGCGIRASGFEVTGTDTGTESVRRGERPVQIARTTSEPRSRDRRNRRSENRVVSWPWNREGGTIQLHGRVTLHTRRGSDEKHRADQSKGRRRQDLDGS